MICNLFLKFYVRHEGFSFYGPRKSDEGADTDLIYNFAGLIDGDFVNTMCPSLQCPDRINTG